MNAFVVSDVGEWSAFFDKLLELHHKRKNSALTQKTVHWPIRLVNVATTKLKGGQEFPYYAVVDKGRAAIGGGDLRKGEGAKTRKGFIAFAAREGGESGDDRVFSKRVHGTQGAEITAKSEAQTQIAFTRQLGITFNNWLDTANEAAWEGEGKAPKKGFKTTVKRTTRRFGAKAVRKAKKIVDDSEDKKKHEGESAKDRTQRLLEEEANRFLAEAGLDVETGLEKENEVELVEEDFEFIPTAGRETRITAAGEKAYSKFVKAAGQQSRSEFDEQEFLREANNARVAARAKERAYINGLVSALQSDRALGSIGTTAATVKREIARGVAREHLAIRGVAGTLGFRVTGVQRISGGGEIGAGLSGINPAKIVRIPLLPPQGEQRKAPAAAPADNPAIRKFIKIPNWVAMAGIFARITGDQIETIWKPNTPVRSDFKLAYIGGGKKVILGSHTGGHLRNGYKLVTTTELLKHVTTKSFIKG